MRHLLFVFLCITIFIPNILHAQQVSYSKAQMQEDYRLLYESLVQYHPEPFMYQSEADLKAFYEKELAKISDSLSMMELQLMSRRLIAQIKCGHTVARPPKSWYDANKGKPIGLPFQIKVIGGKALISNTTEEPMDIAIGDELLAIDDLPVKQMLSDMANIQERDANTNAFVNALIQERFRTYFYFLYGLRPTVTIKYIAPGSLIKTTQVQLTNKPLKPVPEMTIPYRKEFLKKDWITFSADTMNKVAIIKIKSFANRKDFKKTYRAIFQKVKSDNYPHLIVDLRDNGGGYFLNGSRFLTYFADKPFDFTFYRKNKPLKKHKHAQLNFISKLTRFAINLKPGKRKIPGQKTYSFHFKPDRNRYTGKVHVITNGITFSQASIAAVDLKEFGATMYGSETGGAAEGCNAMLVYKLILPHSKVTVNIPYYHMQSNASNPEFGKGLLPDVELKPQSLSSSDEILQEVVARCQ